MPVTECLPGMHTTGDWCLDCGVLLCTLCGHTDHDGEFCYDCPRGINCGPEIR